MRARGLGLDSGGEGNGLKFVPEMLRELITTRRMLRIEICPNAWERKSNLIYPTYLPTTFQMLVQGLFAHTFK